MVELLLTLSAPFLDAILLSPKITLQLGALHMSGTARASLENDWFRRIEAFHITEAGRKDMDEKEADVSRLPLPVAIKLYRRFSAGRCHSAALLRIILESGASMSFHCLRNFTGPTFRPPSCCVSFTLASIRGILFERWEAGRPPAFAPSCRSMV